MRDKETLKKSKAEGESKKLAKANLTLTCAKDIQAMFSYENDYEILDKAVLSRHPRFKFVSPSREVIQRLIIRATNEKEQF